MGTAMRVEPYKRSRLTPIGKFAIFDTNSANPLTANDAGLG
jgi:hypothetical protein